MMKQLWNAFATGVLLATLPTFAAAQEAPAQPPTAPKPINIDLRDVPIRQALEQLFKAWGVDYIIDQNVSGFVNLHLTDQPAENALRLLLRANSIPLVFSKEGNVYQVKLRPVATNTIAAVPPAPTETLSTSNGSTILDVITLQHIDPMDLAGILGVVEVPFGSRLGNPLGNGTGPGFGVGGGNGLLGGGAPGGLFGSGIQGGGSGIGPGGSSGVFGGRNGAGNNGTGNPNNPGNGNRGPGSSNTSPLNPNGYVILGTQDNRLIVTKP